MSTTPKALRQKKILERLKSGGGAASVSELARLFQLSAITIRRDLIELHEKGLIERTWGGALSGEVLAEGSARYESISYTEREQQNAAQKKAIAEMAVQYVSDGDCILLNGGTTVRYMADELRGHQNLHVVTNGLTVAMAIGQSVNPSVYLLPGTVDFRKMSTISQPDTALFREINLRAAFLGVHGLSVRHGLCMLTREEALMNRAFIDMADTVNILVDSSKFQSHAIFQIAPVQKATRLFSDNALPPDTVKHLQDLGIDVILAFL